MLLYYYTVYLWAAPLRGQVPRHMDGPGMRCRTSPMIGWATRDKISRPLERQSDRPFSRGETSRPTEISILRVNDVSTEGNLSISPAGTWFYLAVRPHASPSGVLQMYLQVPVLTSPLSISVCLSNIYMGHLGGVRRGS